MIHTTVEIASRVVGADIIKRIVITHNDPLKIEYPNDSSIYKGSIQFEEKIIEETENSKMFDLLTRQQRMAVKLRASEKRILLSTITAVKEELLRLPSVVNVGEEILPAGRSFDTMGPRVPLSLNNYKSLVEDRDAKKKELEEAAKQKEGSASIAERRRRRRG